MYDVNFLRALDKARTKVKYARITALTLDELPITSVEGRATAGSINIDGKSAVRRTCQLTLVVDQPNMSNYYWGLNTKFKLEVGIRNDIDPQYPKIIWFPQGIYIITNFSIAMGLNNFTINISGKDKMCLLNGEVGGSITAPTHFDSWEEEVDGEWVIRKYPIKQIIRDSVHQLAGEPYHNIVINDLDDKALELLEYRYDEPMFLLRPKDSPDYIQGTLNPNTQMYLYGGQETVSIGAKDAKGNYKYKFDTLVDSLAETITPTFFYLDQTFKNPYCVAKIEYGDTAGYRTTDLIYPGDLIGNVGEALTSVLDKIKNMLGAFEYFYDLDGRFIFQKTRNYVDTVWSPLSEEGYVKDISQHSDDAYVFSGSELISAFSNQPNLNNIRNDFSVWGSRKGVGGQDIPIHMRYAIDEKPIYYKAYDGTEYCTKTYETAIVVTWQELIYQMQYDYRKYNRHDDFEIVISRNNPPIKALNFSGYINGKTGYEAYYIDIEGFWRQLYYPKYALDVQLTKYETKLKKLHDELASYTADAPEKELCQNALKAYEKTVLAFIKDYISNFAMLNVAYFDPYPLVASLVKNTEEIFTKLETNVKVYYNYWHRLVYEEPENLNFWFDFLDLDGDLNKYSCHAIGSRPKAVNDTSVKAIYFRSTPTIIFYQNQAEKNLHTGYRYFQVHDIESMCSISTQGKSAKDALDTLLYDHSYALETVSITAIPVYYLEPNTRVHIYDDKAGISGDYVISKISLPLSYNGTMSLNATKAVDAII